jgi:TP901 family phage tail tape measure protein
VADVAEILVLIKGESSGAKSAIGGVRDGLLGLAKFAAAGAAVLAGFGAVAVKMAADFQTSQTRLVTGAGESAKNLDMVSAGILAMSGTVGQSAEDLSKGMFLIESAGYHGAAALSILKSAAEGAATGGADMTVVADALTTAMHDYNIPAAKANSVTSALIQTVADGKTNLQDLASSLGKVMPVASALGITFQDVTGAMATMTNAGLSARLAAMHLNTTLLALSAPNAVAAKSMKEVGLSTQGVKNLLDGPGGLAAALKTIEQHVGKTFPAGSVAAVTALKDITGGTVGYSTALMLTGANSATFASNVKGIGAVLHGGNTEVQGFSKASHDFGFALKSAGDAAGAAMITMGTKLLPVLTTVARWVGQEIPVALGIVQGAFTWLGTNVLPVIVGAFKDVSTWVSKNHLLFLAIGKLLLGAVGTAFKALSAAVTFVGKNFQWIGPILAGVVAGFVAWKVAMGIQALITGVGAAIGLLQAGMGGLEVSEAAAATTSYGLGAALTVATGPIGLVVAGIALLVAGFVLAYTHVTGFRDVVNTVFGVVVSVIKTAIGVVVGLFKVTPFGFLITHLTDIKNFFANTWNAITSALKLVWQTIGSDVSAAWGGVVSVIKGAVNTIIGVIDTVIGGINKVTGAIPFVGAKLQIPIIPRWSAAGAFVDRPTVIGAGEGGPETVLNRRQFQAMMGGAPLRDVAGSRAATGTVTIQQPLYFYGVSGSDRSMIRQEIEASNKHLVHLLSAAR